TLAGYGNDIGSELGGKRFRHETDPSSEDESSQVRSQPNRGQSHACKAGVIGFTRNLAHEVALRGVNVLGVAPGIMLNPQLKQYVLDPQDDQERAGRDAMIEAITQQVQLGRASLPEEAANMVAFLATEAADYLCGQTIDVAGGQWMG
ncbi:SDR family oxidoreductase, partial [Mycobacterium avium]